MNKKTLYSILLILAVIIFATSYCFATDTSLNSGLESAANGVRDAVGGVENTLEDAAAGISNTSKDATSNLQNAGNDMMNNNDNNNNDNNDNMDYNTHLMGTTTYNDNNQKGYTTTRTATTTDNTFLGMGYSTALIWLILAIVGVAIVSLVYFYSAQTRNYDYENSDD